MEDTSYFSSSPRANFKGDDDNLLVYSITSSEHNSQFDPKPASAPIEPPIIHVYSRRPPPGSCPSPVPSVPSSSDPISNDDLPIALHEGKRQCTYPISSYISYNNL